MRPLNNNKATQYNVNIFDLNTMLDNNEKLEIIVPTCSYRMGVLDIGEYSLVRGVRGEMAKSFTASVFVFRRIMD
jgi:hypothetical protein